MALRVTAAGGLRLTGWLPSWAIGGTPRDVPEREREQLAGLLPDEAAVIVTDSERE
jgi:hypothetical protein